MVVNRVKRTEIRPIEISSEKNTSGNSSGFRQQFGKQMKEDYRIRVTALFDEIVEESSEVLENIDIPKFERYRSLIRKLLNEVLDNAYNLNLECICDSCGKQRIYALVNVIDSKLDDMTKEILNRSEDWLCYISHVDEIRGLIMDLLF